MPATTSNSNRTSRQATGLGSNDWLFCPDGDVFQAAAAGKLSVVTDTIETFTERGIRTTSGEELEADIVCVCTGFHLSIMGDIPFRVDDEPVDWHDTVNYRGMMFTGVPNLAWVLVISARVGLYG